MIVTRRGDRLRVVQQNDHAALAAELLAVWRADGLPEHPHRALRLEATREHDNGWREIDSAPRVGPDGAPYDFRSLPAALRREIWQLGVERFARDRPAVAILVTRHAIELHRSAAERSGDPAWSERLAAWIEHEAALLARVDGTVDDLAENYAWLRLADGLSLGVCEGWSEPFTLESGGGSLRVQVEESPLESVKAGTVEARTLAIDTVEREPTGATATATVVHLDPFPLAGTTTLHVAYREIPARRYASDRDLALELATARWRRQPVRVTR